MWEARTLRWRLPTPHQNLRFGTGHAFAGKILLSSATEFSRSENEGKEENKVLFALEYFTPVANLSNKKAPDIYRATIYFRRTNLLSSTLKDFTSVFGMGTGGAPSVSSPYIDLELKLLRGMLPCCAP